MAYPNTDWPVSVDGAVTRTNHVDIVEDNDFNYPDEQIRALQSRFGVIGEPLIPVQSLTEIQSALVVVGANPGQILVPEAITIDANQTIPANAPVTIAPGGSFAVSGGFTLTINSHINAPPVRIFSGAGSVALGEGGNDYVYLEWWGGGAGVAAATNDAAMALAIAAAATRGATIKLLSGTYDFATQISAPDNMKIEGAGPVQEGLAGGNTTIWNYTGVADAFHFEGTGVGLHRKMCSLRRMVIQGLTASSLIYLKGAEFCRFEDLYLYGHTTNTACGIQFEADAGGYGVYYNIFKSIDIYQCVNGCDLDGDINATGIARGNCNIFERIRCSSYTGTGWKLKGLETNTFINCMGESAGGDYGLQILEECSRMHFHSCYWEYNAVADIDLSHAGLAGTPVFIGCRYSGGSVASGSAATRLDWRIDSYSRLASTEYMRSYLNVPDRFTLPQDEANFNGVGANGSFSGGAGYSNGDVITLDDGTTLTVALVAAGVVTQFDLTTISASTGVFDGETIDQDSVDPIGGTGFDLTPGTANITAGGITANEVWKMNRSGGMGWGADGSAVTDTSIQRYPSDNPGLTIAPGAANQIQAVTSAANSVAIDCADGWNIYHEITEDTTIQNPSNLLNGQFLAFAFEHGAGDLYTVDWGNQYELRDEMFQISPGAANRIYDGIMFLQVGSFGKLVEIGRSQQKGNGYIGIVGTYDFAWHAGAQAEHVLAWIPNNATVVRAHYEVITPFTSIGAATVSFGVKTNDAVGLKAVTNFNDASYAAGYWDFLPDGTAANFTTKTTNQRNIIMTVAGADLTAGKVYIWLECIVSE